MDNLNLVLGPTLAIVVGGGAGLLLGATLLARRLRISPRAALRWLIDAWLDRFRNH